MFLGGGSDSQERNTIQDIVEGYASLRTSIMSFSMGGSDQVPFEGAGVPAVFLNTGTHSDYHQPSDTADKIDFNGLETITKIALELSMLLM